MVSFTLGQIYLPHEQKQLPVKFTALLTGGFTAAFSKSYTGDWFLWFKLLMKQLTSIKEESTFLATDSACASPELFPKPFMKCLLVLVE